ncbi:hypothetical protein WA158_008413 [Blastocystis sp. Blastoise]
MQTEPLLSNTEQISIPQEEVKTEEHHGANKNNIAISCLSKFISGYALNIINIVVEILEDVYGNELITDASKGLMSSASLIGCVTGQIVIGFLGDYLGRKAALFLTVLFNIIGCLGSTFAFGFGPVTIVHALIFWRFVMGFGIGGTYPLSAVMGTESASEGNKEKTGAFVFTFHCLGWICNNNNNNIYIYIYMLVGPALSSILLWLWPNGKEYIWRILLFVSLIAAVAISFIHSTETGVSRKDKDANKPSMWKLLFNKENALKMIGTGGAWFLFDINLYYYYIHYYIYFFIHYYINIIIIFIIIFLYIDFLYGQALFSNLVVAKLFGEDTSALTKSLAASLFNLLGYVGSLLSIWAVNWWGLRILQFQGFAARSVLFILLGLCLTLNFENAPTLLALYSIVFFYGNFGPNTTTFLLPAVTYSIEVRSTLNGISAALGKTGASIGAYAYEAIAKSVGADKVMYIACVLAACAGILTMVFIPKEVDDEIISKKKQHKLEKEQKEHMIQESEQIVADIPTDIPKDVENATTSQN